jgi:hypothetical protein
MKEVEQRRHLRLRICFVLFVNTKQCSFLLIFFFMEIKLSVRVFCKHKMVKSFANFFFNENKIVGSGRFENRLDETYFAYRCNLYCLPATCCQWQLISAECCTFKLLNLHMLIL